MTKSPILNLPLWFINNSIASTLLVLVIVIMGSLSFSNIHQETSPSFRVNEIAIEVKYPGASPTEINNSIILFLENKLKNLSGVEQISAYIGEGESEVLLELGESENPDTMLSQIKNAVDSIDSFPAGMERLQINIVEEFDSLVEIGIHGHESEVILFKHANQLKQSLLSELDVAAVEISGARTPEVIIEVNYEQLIKHDLTIKEVVSQVKGASVNVPAGSVVSSSGTIAIRANGLRQKPEDFYNITVKNDGVGGKVLLTDIANVFEGFYGERTPFLVNGEPGFEIMVFQDKHHKPIDLSKEIISFINSYQQKLPPSLSLTVLQDQSEAYLERINLLLKNGMLGMLLIGIVLALFIDIKLAFWVSLGIPVAILGALALMPNLLIPLNMITLFAFILTLGILVDDAVIVAENIHKKVHQGIEIQDALKQGVQEMTVPVIVSVLTNIIAFIPLMFVPGELGVMYKPMTMLIFSIFVVSLIEALFILPLHLSGINKQLNFPFIVRINKSSQRKLEWFKNNVYQKYLLMSFNKPQLVIALFLSILLLVFSWVFSGRSEVGFVPKIESTRIDAEVEFSPNASMSEKQKTITFIEKLGKQAFTDLATENTYQFAMQSIEGNTGSATFMLVPEKDRSFTARDFVEKWRSEIGTLPNVKSIFFDYKVGPGGGKELVIELSHNNPIIMEKATIQLMNLLKRVPGLADVDSQLINKNARFSITPNMLGKQLGVNEKELGEILRNRFHGEETNRFIEHGAEVRVRVIMSKQQHYFAEQLQNMLIKTPLGEWVELGQVANIKKDYSPLNINKVDGNQLVEVTASILREKVNSNLIFSNIENDILPILESYYQELEIELGGEAKIESRVNSEVLNGVAIALTIIFALVAIVLKSYLYALIVVSVIPFCLAAAMLGHILMGAHFSVMSLFGMIALSGLVINGSFVILLQVRNLIIEGAEFQSAVIQSCLNRFRPVLLTALTTSTGLIPMIFESSTQALYLVPMAISLSFGSLFSIFTILFLTPALCSITRGKQ